MSCNIRSLWLLVLLCVISVDCVGNVHSWIREDVLLSCVNDEGLHPEEINVYWRNKDDKVLVDILGGVQDTESQDPIFRGRVVGFPGQYRRGNYSIVLKNLQVSDSGLYSCHIPAVDFEVKVQLSVKSRREGRRPLGNAAVAPGFPLLAQLSVLLLSSFL